MITFDKLKLITSPNNISNMKRFGTNYDEQGQLKEHYYHISSPCVLDLRVKRIANELVIEFTGKLLKDQYPLLINVNTIRTCFEAIKRIGVCDLDIDAIMNDAYVVKCDVTKDVDGIDAVELNNYIKTHIDNYDRWKVKKILNNGNLILEKNVTTDKCKRRLSIYNKEEEMEKSENKDFLSWAGIGVKDSFKGKTRLELSLNTIAAIRKDLNINDTRLETVLNADANPIADLLDEVLRPDTCYTSNVTNFAEFDRLYTLEHHYKWDVEAIENKGREIYGKNYHKNRLEHYRRLIDEHFRNNVSSSNPYDFQTLCSFDTDDEIDSFTVISVSDDYWHGSNVTAFDSSYSDNYDFIIPANRIAGEIV